MQITPAENEPKAPNAEPGEHHLETFNIATGQVAMRTLSALLLALALALGSDLQSAPPSARRAVRAPAVATGRRQQRPLLAASRPAAQSPTKGSQQQSGGGWAAAGGVAGLAVASEVVQYVNTGAAILMLQRSTGSRSFADLVESVAAYFSSFGTYACPIYAALLLAITVVPAMSALLFIVLAGMVFGPVVGTAVVSLSLSTAAAVSAMAARAIAKRRGFTLANIDPKVAAVDRSIAAGQVHSTLLLVVLLRLSPVMPFTFSNYLAGLTSVPPWILFVGTLLGTLPTQFVYVSAGALGRQALHGGVHLPPALIVVGVLATVAAILMVGHVAQQAIKKMDLGDITELSA